MVGSDLIVRIPDEEFDVVMRNRSVATHGFHAPAAQRIRVGSAPGVRTRTAWVYRIAINTAITGLRRRSRQPTHVPLEAAADVVSPPTAVGSDPRADMLYRVIRRLSDVDRALVMCYLDDLSYREIADVLGLSETNVGARLSRAKTRLQGLVKSIE